ncbi:hypothetical protein [Pedobacter sp. SYSU D00535]|uniref:hypothetical protein n=1 Tax=Pedobacter sp. SYSU D00535 TaxID=2810308 RepID=UPI001A958B57|nr:hypothetical protein [Pedobacter sp. SYSU D00535]
MLKDFTITNFKRDTFTNTNISPAFFEWSESMDLIQGGNKLNIFLDNDPEASTHGYLRGGQIVDTKVAFAKDIRIGMSAQDFYQSFFDYFPKELSSKYKVVWFESCALDVSHLYIFNKGLLSSVKFISQ